MTGAHSSEVGERRVWTSLGDPGCGLMGAPTRRPIGLVRMGADSRFGSADSRDPLRPCMEAFCGGPSLHRTLRSLPSPPKPPSLFSFAKVGRRRRGGGGDCKGRRLAPTSD